MGGVKYNYSSHYSVQMCGQMSYILKAKAWTTDMSGKKSIVQQLYTSWKTLAPFPISGGAFHSKNITTNVEFTSIFPGKLRCTRLKEPHYSGIHVKFVKLFFSFKCDLKFRSQVGCCSFPVLVQIKSGPIEMNSRMQDKIQRGFYQTPPMVTKMNYILWLNAH